MWLGRPSLMLSYLGTKVGAFFGADKPAWSLLRDIVTTVSFATFDDQKKSAPEVYFLGHTGDGHCSKLG